jgi:predicted amidohydrolase YtcJ
LIRNASLLGKEPLVDIRLDKGIIAGIGPALSHDSDGSVIDAGGGVVLPGLHDHHIHLMAYAASLHSLQCGPPDLRSEADLVSALRARNRPGDRGWVRGIGYHPSVAGDIDRDWLDRCIPDRPVRIQHRGGRMWVLNSRALEVLQVSSGRVPPGLEHVEGRPTGRLYEGDLWMRSRLQSQFPDLSSASKRLARYGITGLTDTTPTNGPEEWAYFRQCQAEGALLQRVRFMGTDAIQGCQESGLLTHGEFKIHLLESRLPELDTLCRDIASAHDAGRAVAIHCVTLTELVFALYALEAAGVRMGDRIEHGSVCPPDQLKVIQELGLRVVTQPHFIAERGDQYLTDVDAREQPWLYRAASFLTAGVPLAAGSDAPFGGADPWQAMRAAVARRTASGEVMDREESLTPEQALRLFLSAPGEPGVGEITLTAGSPADLCLLHVPWDIARHDLRSEQVRATWRAGQQIYWSG